MSVKCVVGCQDKGGDIEHDDCNARFGMVVEHADQLICSKADDRTNIMIVGSKYIYHEYEYGCCANMDR